jgi:serine O-acetyltransferase
MLFRHKLSGRMRIGELIHSDRRRFQDASEACTKLGFYAAVLYRLSHSCSERGMMLSARILQLLSHVITGAEVSHRAEIGPALAILHPTGVMIGPRVKIGKMATVCQGCSISQNTNLEEDGPTIGDHFWAGPGCAVMGQIRLGDHVWVGPNAVVFKDVDSNMTALGNPARIFHGQTFRNSSSKGTG